jgi:hypothetical protein
MLQNLKDFGWAVSDNGWAVSNNWGIIGVVDFMNFNIY